MKLYRLVAYRDAVPEKFQGKPLNPCVPQYRMEDEDDTTPRICVSSSLDGCLSAIGPPKVLWALDWVCLCAHFTVLRFDSEQIESRRLIGYEELAVRGLVRDARENKEHWITAPCKPESVESLYLTSFRLRQDARLVVNGEMMKLLNFERSEWAADRTQALRLHNRDAYIALCGCLAEDDEKGNVDK